MRESNENNLEEDKKEGELPKGMLFKRLVGNRKPFKNSLCSLI